MADITWSNVTDHAPELSTVSAGAQANILAVANALVYSYFGDDSSNANYKLARIYFAAHFGTIQLQAATGAAGPVVSEMEGGLSRTYGQPYGGLAPESFDSTAYGKAYQALVRMSRARGPMIL